MKAMRLHTRIATLVVLVEVTANFTNATLPAAAFSPVSVPVTLSFGSKLLNAIVAVPPAVTVTDEPPTGAGV